MLTITKEHIITGYIDRLAELEGDPPEEWDAAEDGPWPGHDEPSAEERLTQMLAYYRLETSASYLIVHDADATVPWEAQGFTRLPPPDDVPRTDAVTVLIWGAVPQPIYGFLRKRGLAWTRSVHRRG